MGQPGSLAPWVATASLLALSNQERCQLSGLILGTVLVRQKRAPYLFGTVSAGT